MQNLPTNQQPNTSPIRSAVIRRDSQTVKSRGAFPVTAPSLETVTVEIYRGHDGEILGLTKYDTAHECEECVETGYRLRGDEYESGIHLSFRSGPEFGDSDVAEYDVTDCDGVWLCAHHAAEVEA